MNDRQLLYSWIYYNLEVVRTQSIIFCMMIWEVAVIFCLNCKGCLFLELCRRILDKALCITIDLCFLAADGAFSIAFIWSFLGSGCFLNGRLYASCFALEDFGHDAAWNLARIGFLNCLLRKCSQRLVFISFWLSFRLIKCFRWYCAINFAYHSV